MNENPAAPEPGASQNGYPDGQSAGPSPLPPYTGPAQAPYSGQADGQPAYQQPPVQPGYGAGQPGYGYVPPQQGPQPAQFAQPGYSAPQSSQYGPSQTQPQAYGYPPRTYLPGAKSKIAAGLLGIFLGCFGVHNFYLGYTGKAVAQLLLTLLGWILLGLGPIAAAIWGLVEGILILSSYYGSPWHRDGHGVELND